MWCLSHPACSCSLLTTTPSIMPSPSSNSPGKGRGSQKWTSPAPSKFSSWQDAYYFAFRLTCGCSPKLFDTLSEALCWILSIPIPFLVHLLDDLLINSPPSLTPASSLVTLISVFSNLRVPLSAEKTKGPSTSLEFLRITLDTNLFQASLPVEKLKSAF